MKRKVLLSLKKLFLGAVSAGCYLFLICFVLLLPRISFIMTSLFEQDYNRRVSIATVIMVFFVVILTSNKVYGMLHSIYCAIYIKTKKSIIKNLIIPFICVNDCIYAMYKRTFIFSLYLFFIIAEQLGYHMEGEVNFVFACVLLIGIDRVLSNWEKEKKISYAYGEKVYNDSGDILDDLSNLTFKN